MVKKAIVRKPVGTKSVVKKPVVGKPKTKVPPEVEEEIDEEDELDEELDEDEDEVEEEEIDEEDDEDDDEEDDEDDDEEEDEPAPKKKAPVKAPVKKSPIKKTAVTKVEEEIDEEDDEDDDEEEDEPAPKKKAPVKKSSVKKTTATSVKKTPVKKTSAVANKEEVSTKKNSKFGPRKNAPKKEKSSEIEEFGSFTVDDKKKYMQNAIAEAMIKHNIFGAKDYSEDVEDIIKELSLSFTKDIIDAFGDMYNEAFEKHCKISIGKANFVLRKLKAKVMEDNPVMNGRNVIVPPTYKMVASVLEKKDVIDCQKKGNDLYVVDGKKKTKVTDEYIKQLNEEFFGEEE